MKIYLFLPNKILSFSIPIKVSGNYNFDENAEESAKLINIEARDGNWYLYSTYDVNIIADNSMQDSILLTNNTFYVLKRDNVEYLIFATNSYDNSFASYRYGEQLNLVIGNDDNCNIKYNCPYVVGTAMIIRLNEGNFFADVYDNNIYSNDNIMPKQTANVYLPKGTQLNLYGLRIFLLNGFIMINNPGAVQINAQTSNLVYYPFKQNSKPEEVEFKDVDLYNKEDYFSKSPRIRRVIKTKEMTLNPPPNQNEGDTMPALLTIGPMLTMGIVSIVTFFNTITKIKSGEVTLESTWPSLLSSGMMIVSMVLWPSLTRAVTKRIQKRRKENIFDKYTKYINSKREELMAEEKLQKEILIENIIPVRECLNIIQNGKVRFWDKRIEQSDFLVVRIGVGDEYLDAKISYPENGFDIDEDDLKKQADAVIEHYKYISNVPIGYSLYENNITAFMGNQTKCYGMLNNIILQLITFYSYEDIKLVIITNKSNKDKWEYVKYLNHNFSNDKKIRFFSSNPETSKVVCDYLNMELQSRIQMVDDKVQFFKPYYIIITDDYTQIRRNDFIKGMTELSMNLGFSLLIMEDQMSKLPSKCSDFINLGENSSSMLNNSFEEQEIRTFTDEIDYSIDMMSVARRLSNIPIEFEEGGEKQLPEAISFMEMEKVGKVEQLNIMNRWDTNDSTQSLKAEVGVDEEGSLMYLDLHEKFHGPHGLIAGMTGSGKSEFIITYILSMAINYSPDDVAFILIDYKGGGLAYAFENKTTGVSLPHLAGTITNLDKAEMDRTLVSIDSEMQRRQGIFNAARDKLGESTMDIYKYQRFYKEGRLEEPIPHLFIICDEFAELKSQQPDFMDSLISTARIGRSLGVHLILATQKPSGVVNDQIWSNSKFRVCLKVQDESDSKEMLKRPEAAALKQTGRFYLQVGFDEYFALGQSGWCGAKYYPSEKIVKQIDKSVNFIDDTANVIKSIQATNNIKVEAQGEQLAAIMNNILEVAGESNKKARKLWLDDIAPIIVIDELIQKYNYKEEPYKIRAIVGEYDAPEKQEQGLLAYNVSEQGNTIVFSNDEIERENFINSIVYSICKFHGPEEVNFYGVDYGSEQLRMFNGLPQMGGVVYLGDDEGIKNLFKLIIETIKTRKKELVSYGGSLETYNNKNEKKMPSIIFIINNYEGLLEVYDTIHEDISSIGRDCERYGVYLFLTASSPSSLGRRVSQCFNNRYAIHFTDSSDYFSTFNERIRIYPRDTEGRGLVNNGEIHEFQTALIVNKETDINEYLSSFITKTKETFSGEAEPIPSLPEKVTMEHMERYISTLSKVPIGIAKESLKPVRFDFTTTKSTSITSNRIENCNSFMDSLLEVLIKIKGTNIFFIDSLGLLPSANNKKRDNYKVNYFNSNFDIVFDKLIELEENPNNKQYRKLYIFYGLDKLRLKADNDKIAKLMEAINNSENSTIIMCESAKGYRSIDSESWYSMIKNANDGIWIGRGFSEQQNYRIAKITREMSENIPNNYAFALIDNNAELIKVLQFNDIAIGDEEDE